MGSDPLEGDLRSFMTEGVQALDQVEILDGSALPFPATLLPSCRPLIDGVDTELAVGVHR